MSNVQNVFTNQEEGLQSYFDDIRLNSLLTLDEERDVAEKAKNGNEFAIERLVKANLRLVIKIAKAFLGTGMALQDLIQEGNIGLMTAVKKFDFSRNIRFSTYAAWWIKQAIRRAIANKLRLVRLPYRKEESLRKMQVFLTEKAHSINHHSDIDEMSHDTNISKQDIVDLLPFCGANVSFDASFGEDKSSLHDFVADTQNCVEVEFENKVLKQQINNLVNTLEQKEKQIVELRYALNGSEKQTLKSISHEMGISPETVRQIEIRALKKMRNQAVSFYHL